MHQNLQNVIDLADCNFQNEAWLDGAQFDVAPDVLYRQVEHEAILLHIPNGTYYSLNETSISFWEALQQKRSLTEAIDRVLSEYEVERSQVLQDLKGFLQALLNLGLIVQVQPQS